MLPPATIPSSVAGCKNTDMVEFLGVAVGENLEVWVYVDIGLDCKSATPLSVLCRVTETDRDRVIIMYMFQFE